MKLEDITKKMRELLAATSVDLEKANNGNKAAAQRVRTGTIKLEKMAREYRRESIHAEKTGTGPKRPNKAKAGKKQKHAVAAKPVKKAVMPMKAQPKGKMVPQKMMKRPTAKIPARKS